MEANYTNVERSCGHTNSVLIPADAVRAAETIVELKTSTCPACTRIARVRAYHIGFNGAL